MPSNLREHQFFLMCILMSCQAFTDDDTENLDLRVDGPFLGSAMNKSLNRARSAGANELGPVGCRELRSMKYVSDGHCTSLTPVKELVCAGDCLPIRTLPSRIGASAGNTLWGGQQDQWSCVTDHTRNQRVRLRCRDGSVCTYRITVVTSCKCKQYSRQHDESGPTRDLTQTQARRGRGKRAPREDRVP